MFRRDFKSTDWLVAWFISWPVRLGAMTIPSNRGRNHTVPPRELKAVVIEHYSELQIEEEYARLV